MSNPSNLNYIERLSVAIEPHDVNIFEEMRDTCPKDYFEEADTCQAIMLTGLDCLNCWTQTHGIYVKRKEYSNGFEIGCLDCSSDDVSYDDYEFTYQCNSCGQSQ